MKYPFHQKESNGRLIREFSADVASDELVWHRDRADRRVKVRSGEGWQLQLENRLPKNLVPGEVYFIPKNTYHRVIKGQQRLVIEIEENPMKVTKRQLRRLIREVFLESEQPWGSYAEKSSSSYSDVITMSPHGDSVLVDGMETYVTDVPQQLEHASGFPMDDIEADKLIAALDKQMSSGYVELSVEYKNGKWGGSW